jgi:hypothetical protein
MIMSEDQWFGFFCARGSPSVSEWVNLEEEDREAAINAGCRYRDDVIGNIGKATRDPLHILHLLRDKEGIEDLLTVQFFSEYSRARQNERDSVIQRAKSLQVEA